jgi:hypothetical protein
MPRALLLMGSSDFLRCLAGAICTQHPDRPGRLTVSRLILAWTLKGRTLGYPWYSSGYVFTIVLLACVGFIYHSYEPVGCSTSLPLYYR